MKKLSKRKTCFIFVISSEYCYGFVISSRYCCERSKRITALMSYWVRKDEISIGCKWVVCNGFFALLRMTNCSEWQEVGHIEPVRRNIHSQKMGYLEWQLICNGFFATLRMTMLWKWILRFHSEWQHCVKKWL